MQLWRTGLVGGGVDFEQIECGVVAGRGDFINTISRDDGGEQATIAYSLAQAFCTEVKAQGRHEFITLDLNRLQVVMILSLLLLLLSYCCHDIS